MSIPKLIKQNLSLKKIQRIFLFLFFVKHSFKNMELHIRIEQKVKL